MATSTFGNRLDRWVLRKGFSGKWPLLSLRLIIGRRFAAGLGAQLGYRRAARSVIGTSRWGSFISRAAGYRLYTPETFPELPRVVAACQDVFDRHKADVTANEAHNKPYFFNIMTTDDLARHPVLLDFALSAPVTEAVTGYLCLVPRLHSIGIFYSAINDTVAGSQMYHVDGDSLAQIKCFVNVWDVGPGGGAFTFLPKDKTTSSLRNHGLMKTASDEDVTKVVPLEQQVVVSGPSGGGVLVDTSGCMHQGSRARTSPRLVFQFQYVPRPDALLAKTSGKVVPGGHILVTPPLLDGVSLSNPKAMMFVA